MHAFTCHAKCGGPDTEYMIQCDVKADDPTAGHWLHYQCAGLMNFHKLSANQRGMFQFTCFKCITGNRPHTEAVENNFLDNLSETVENVNNNMSESILPTETNDAIVTGPLNLEGSDVGNRPSTPTSSEGEISSSDNASPAFLDASGSPLPVFTPRASSKRVILPGVVRFPKEDGLKNIIFADSQGKFLKREILDPSMKTKIETHRGMSIDTLIKKMKREIPPDPLEPIEAITLFMGGNDLATPGMTISKFLDILDSAVEFFSKKCPNAKFFITDTLPRGDCQVDVGMMDICLREWCKNANVTLIPFHTLISQDMWRDKVHLNRVGVRKVCRSIKKHMNLPVFPKHPVTNDNEQEHYVNSTEDSSLHVSTYQGNYVRPPQPAMKTGRSFRNYQYSQNPQKWNRRQEASQMNCRSESLLTKQNIVPHPQLPMYVAQDMPIQNMTLN